jgi:pseudouridine synthase
VGRLDYHSEGLLLLTNDGQLTHAVLHPSRGVEKTYQVKVKGLVEPKTLQRLQRGLRLPDGPARAVRARLLRAAEANCWVELTVLEGRKHLVRRMLQALGHPVLRLRRVRIDGVGLGGLAPGGLRPLTEKELQSLRRHSGLLREAV